jgi:hypothetical protein
MTAVGEKSTSLTWAPTEAVRELEYRGFARHRFTPLNSPYQASNAMRSAEINFTGLEIMTRGMTCREAWYQSK